MLLSDILRLNYPLADFRKDIIIQDDTNGQGQYIKEWNLDDPEPSQSDLDQWAIDYDLQYRQKQAVNQRRYPPLGAQLDMMYHDHINNTTMWLDTIAAIKLAYPKPTE